MALPPTTTSDLGPGASAGPQTPASHNNRRKPPGNEAADSTDPVLQATLPIVAELSKHVEVMRAHLKKNNASDAAMGKLVSIISRLETAVRIREDILTRKTFEKTLNAAMDSVVERVASSIVSGATTAPIAGPGSAPARPRVASYATVAASSARPEERDVVWLLSEAERKSMAALERSVLRAKVEDALHALPALHKVCLEFVRISMKGNLHVRARSVADAVLIQRHRAELPVPLTALGKIHATLYTVAVNFVPTSFDPSRTSATSELHAWNATAVPHPNDIVRVHWLNPKAVESNTDKRSATMLMHLANPQAASALIWSGTRVRPPGTDKPVSCETMRYIPPPTQCFRCQKYGHSSKFCPSANDPTTEACARCAGNHATKVCSCTNAAPCSETRCNHLAPVKCANCFENHKSTHSQCPVRKAAYSANAQRPEYSNPYFVPNFSPDGVPTY